MNTPNRVKVSALRIAALVAAALVLGCGSSMSGDDNEEADFGLGEASFVTPTNGQTVSGVISVETTAPAGAVSVAFSLDGTAFAEDRNGAPWTVSLDTTKYTNGDYRLRAISRDTRGKMLSRETITVRFANTITPPPPPPPPTGTGVPVPSSIASDCSVDVTSQMLSWIASVPNNSTLSFGAGKCYRIEGVLELRGRSGLVFEGNGATFRSLNPPEDQRPLWRVIASKGFVFKNMILKGSYANGGTYSGSVEHAHGFDLRGTQAEVTNTTITDVGGDCVYFGLGYDSSTRSSGSYHDSSCARTGRNGASVTAGNDIRVERVTTERIGFIGFDIEPNIGPGNESTGWGTARITVTGNTIGDYRLYAWAVIEQAPNIDQVFSNNTITSPKGLRIGIIPISSSVFRARNITITGNRATVATWSPAFEIKNVDHLTVTSNVVPLTGGTMATVDASCDINISSNTITGGSSQSSVTNTRTGC
jgi:hypothetical protein